MCDDKDMQEVKDRCRRIETRLTKYLEQNGFDTQRRMPTFRGSTVNLPSMDCSMADMLAAVPTDWSSSHAIFVEHKGKTLFAFYI